MNLDALEVPRVVTRVLGQLIGLVGQLEGPGRLILRLLRLLVGLLRIFLSLLRALVGLVGLVLGLLRLLRGLGCLLLLAAALMLDAAFLATTPWRFVVTILAYAWVIKGMVLVYSPHVGRRWLDWATESEHRLRLLAWPGVALGLILIVLGIFVYPSSPNYWL